MRRSGGDALDPAPDVLRAAQQVEDRAGPVDAGNGITPGLSFAVARDTALKDKRALLADFGERLVRARAWALTDPAAYATVWSKLIGLPEAVPLRWFRRAQYRNVPIDRAVIADEQANIDLYVRAGLIPKARALRADAIFDTGFSQPAAVR